MIFISFSMKLRQEFLSLGGSVAQLADIVPSSLTTTELSLSVLSGDYFAAISLAKSLALCRFHFVSRSIVVRYLLTLPLVLFLLSFSLRVCKRVLMRVIG